MDYMIRSADHFKMYVFFLKGFPHNSFIRYYTFFKVQVLCSIDKQINIDESGISFSYPEGTLNDLMPLIDDALNEDGDIFYPRKKIGFVVINRQNDVFKVSFRFQGGPVKFDPRQVEYRSLYDHD